jgi:hypothetical protein
MDRDEILEKIDALEQEQAENEFGSVAYDFTDAELQNLYLLLDRLVDN